MTALIGILAVTGCGGGGGGDTVVIDPSDTSVELSGVFSDGVMAIDGALITPYAIDEPDAPQFSSKDTDVSGAFTIVVVKDTPVSLAFSKFLFAPIRTQYTAYSVNTAGLDFKTVSVADAEVVIDNAFGGMMFDLADKAWLAIDVADSTGVNVDGVTITPTAAPSGGGALMCDGTLSGASITIAPPCLPDRSSPMYLAYYDAGAEISIMVGSSKISAPVRVGEITIIDVEQ